MADIHSEITDIQAKQNAIAQADAQLEGMTVHAWNVMMTLQEGLLAAYCAKTMLSPSETVFKMIKIPGKYGMGWGTFVCKNPNLGI